MVFVCPAACPPKTTYSMTTSPKKQELDRRRTGCHHHGPRQPVRIDATVNHTCPSRCSGSQIGNRRSNHTYLSDYILTSKHP